MARKVNYVNNKDLLIELEISRNQNRPTDKLVNMLMVLVSRYATKSNWVGYSWNEDMQGHALIPLVTSSWKKFNPAKSSNPFAFFTQCIKNSFRQVLKIEKHQTAIKNELLIKHGLNPSSGYDVDADGGAERYSEFYNNDEFDIWTSMDNQDELDDKAAISNALSKIENIRVADLLKEDQPAGVEGVVDETTQVPAEENIE
jgi:hypothetical protein